MKKNSFRFDTLLDNKRFTAALSIVLAFFAWLIVVSVIDPQSDKSILVAVDFEYNKAAYVSQGLNILEKPSKTVSVQVKGDGSVLGSLAASDIIVYPNYSAVKGAGSYTLKLDIKNAGGGKKFEIVQQDLYVDVTFDKVVTQKFTVNVNATGIQPADGYYMDLPVASPAEITLSGPESSMNRIAKIVANVELNEQRTESAIVTGKLQFIDEGGKPVTDTNITADAAQVEVTIPIYKIKELPLKVEYTSVPTGFDPEVLKPKLSEQTIRVAGPAAQLDSLTAISAGIVDLAVFELGKEVTTNIELPEGLRNVDGLQSVTITFDTIGYTIKTVTVTEVRTINVAEGVTITFPTERVNNVTLVGEEAELEALSATSVVAQVDASSSNLSVAKGQQNISVQIVVPSSKKVFATGSYTILCNVETENLTPAAPQGEKKE